MVEKVNFGMVGKGGGQKVNFRIAREGHGQ
jgi:hypothetical protein